MAAVRAPGTPLHEQLTHALRTAELDPIADARPLDRRDRFLSLLRVYDLHTAPLEVVGPAVRHQGHPAVAAVKSRLEADWLAELAAVEAPAVHDADDALRALRALAARGRLPAVYRWLATEAGWSELVAFLALEGGPDGGFDDLVAACQVGLSGSAKLELAKNFWDELGQGDGAAVHTALHDRLVAAVGMPRVPREEQPVEALERSALCGLLATNRRLQPEMVGVLGLIELQAGPRCRLVLQALDRLGAPAEAYPFYAVHAEVDPVHGKDWLEKAVHPLVVAHPDWGPRIVAGAGWRARVNEAFFSAVHGAASSDTAAA